MSTYLSNKNHFRFNIESVDASSYLREYLNYLVSVENLASRTVLTYYKQLHAFLCWVKGRDMLVSPDELLKLTVADVPFERVAELQPLDIIAYLSYAANNLNNGAETRSLKLTSLKRFYSYFQQMGKLDRNPTENISRPKQEKILPRYLTLEQSELLLRSIDGEYVERDYCIITLFLNCGMRLSELAGMNVDDVGEEQIRLFGKGRKERMVYLNEACKDALEEYITTREGVPTRASKEPALWLSRRTGRRLTDRRIEQIVEKHLRAAGLGSLGFSPHKLRHTAATLMYQSGSAQLLELKTILGHENTRTTEIYTHLNEQQVKDAIVKGPLAQVKRPGTRMREVITADE